jgi:hypothetical protein
MERVKQIGWGRHARMPMRTIARVADRSTATISGFIQPEGAGAEGNNRSL